MTLGDRQLTPGGKTGKTIITVSYCIVCTDGVLSRRTRCARLWWQTVDYQPTLCISRRQLPGEHCVLEQ